MQQSVPPCAEVTHWRPMPGCACVANACSLWPRRKMSNPFEYHPELGLYYHEVAPGLLCGTQLRTPADVERLAGVPHFISVLSFFWLVGWSQHFGTLPAGRGDWFFHAHIVQGWQCPLKSTLLRYLVCTWPASQRRTHK